MSTDQDNFAQLRRLLALKKHEQPPPGYFQHFSQDVIARIRAGEGRARVPFSERLSWNFPWIERLRSVLELRPVLAGAFGIAVCGFLISAGVYTEPAEVPSPTGALFAGSGLQFSPPVVSASARQPEAPAVLPVAATFTSMGGVRSLQSLEPPFEAAKPQFQPLLYRVSPQ